MPADLERATEAQCVAVDTHSRPHRGLSGDVALTALTSAVLIVGNVVTLALLAHRGADAIFAPYSLTRRLAVGFQPILCLGMNIGLVRFLPGRTTQYRVGLSRRALKYFAFALLVSTFLAAVMRPLVASQMPLLAPTATYWAAWMNIAATAVVAMTYAMYRAEMQQRRANLLNLLSVTLAPLLIVAVAPQSWGIDALLAAAGAGTLAAAVLISWPHLVWLWREKDASDARAVWERERRSLIGFSLARVPAAVSVGLMTVIGPWLAASGDAVREASYLLAGFAFAQGLSTALGALGLVLMPRVASYTSDGLDDRSALLIEKGLFASMLVAVVATPLLIAEAGPLVRWWLGSDLAAGVQVVQVVLLAVPAVLVYSLLGPVSDASARQPVTTWAAVLGLGVCAAGSFVWRTASTGTAFAFCAGTMVSAAVVMGSVLRRFRVPMHIPTLAVWTATSLLACAAIGLLGRLGSWDSAVELGVAVLAGFALITLGVRTSPRGMGLWDSVVALGVRRRDH